MQTIQQLATHYSQFLIKHPHKNILISKEETPDNFLQFIFNIHDEHKLMPNDYIYSFVKEALEIIADTSDQYIDWIYLEHHWAVRYIVDEVYHDEIPYHSITDMIGAGQERLKNWIKDNCLNFLRDELSKIEEEAA